MMDQIIKDLKILIIQHAVTEFQRLGSKFVLKLPKSYNFYISETMYFCV